jgi:hypothetical protein
MNQNTNLSERIQRYTQIAAPRYAVLIEGPWGSGKTHFVLEQTTAFKGDEHIEQLGKTTRRYLSRRGREASDEETSFDTSAIYVSLNGCSNIEDFQSRLFVARFPLVSKGGLSSLAKQLGKHFLGIDPRIYAIRQNSLYIFDDVERCEMPMRQTLGLINELVEHRDCRVILLCNPLGLTDTAMTAWTQEFEKIIGLRYEFVPDIAAAYDAFVDEINDANVRETLRRSSVRSRLYRIFSAVGNGNLRAVKRSIGLVGDIIRSVPESKREYEEAIEDMIAFIFSYSLGVRSKLISDDDLSEMVKTDKHYIYSNEDGSDIQKFYRKLSSERLKMQSFFPASLMYDILRFDCVDAHAVQGALAVHARFTEPEVRPSWQTVWDFTRNDDDTFETAFADMRAKWSAREYRNMGEILHVAMLTYWLADKGLIDATKVQIDMEVDAYLENLPENENFGLTEPISTLVSREVFPTFGLVPIGDRGASSIFGQVDPPLIDEVRNKLWEKLRSVESDMRPVWGRNVIELIDPNSEDFEACIGFNARGEGGKFCSIPIFSVHHVTGLVEKLKSLGVEQQFSVMRAFKKRYDSNTLSTHAAWVEEEEFLSDFYLALLRESGESSGIAAVRWAELAEIIAENRPNPRASI